jgi:ABC-2 type transport system permease protein
MEFSIKRVNALVKKEMKDFTKNMNVSLMCILPILFAFIFTNMRGGDFGHGMPKTDLLNTCLNMSLILSATFAVSMLIAEEKEKNTMRTLMLSSVAPIEFLLGKAVVMFLFTTVSNIAIYFIAGMDIQYFGHYLFWSTLVVLSMIQIGGIMGLIAPNQMATGVIGMPVLMSFLLIPMLAPASDIMKKIASLLPNYNLQVILGRIMSGAGYEGSTNNMLAILAWIVLAATAFAYAYNKKGLDK